MTADDRQVLNQILSVAQDAAVLNIQGCGAVAAQVIDAQQAAAWAGTVSFEASLDGQTFVAFNMVPSNSVTPATSATAAGCWSGNCGGYRFFRARLSTATTGGVRVNVQSATAGGKTGA